MHARNSTRATRHSTRTSRNLSRTSQNSTRTTRCSTRTSRNSTCTTRYSTLTTQCSARTSRNFCSYDLLLVSNVSKLDSYHSILVSNVSKLDSSDSNVALLDSNVSILDSSLESRRHAESWIEFWRTINLLLSVALFIHSTKQQDVMVSRGKTACGIVVQISTECLDFGE